MDFLGIIVTFVLGFIVGASLAGAGSRVQIEQEKAKSAFEFRRGWWFGANDVRVGLGLAPMDTAANPAPEVAGQPGPGERPKSKLGKKVN
jgi:hypothetical protein